MCVNGPFHIQTSVVVLASKVNRVRKSVVVSDVSLVVKGGLVS